MLHSHGHYRWGCTYSISESCFSFFGYTYHILCCLPLFFPLLYYCSAYSTLLPAFGTFPFSVPLFPFSSFFYIFVASLPHFIYTLCFFLAFYLPYFFNTIFSSSLLLSSPNSCSQSRLFVPSFSLCPSILLFLISYYLLLHFSLSRTYSIIVIFFGPQRGRSLI